MDSYLAFAEEFSKDYGFDVNIIYRNVPSSAVKPILRFKRDSDIRKRAEKAIAQTLKDKHAVTGKYVNTVIGIIPEPKKFASSPIAISSAGAKDAFAVNTVKDKIRLITSALTSGQMKVLTTIMEKHQLNNEYEALSLVIKWASEKGI